MPERTTLQAARRQLGYSAAKTIAMLERQPRADQITITTSTSLKTKLSRWENGHESVGLPEYRRLFRKIYGRTNAELGFLDERTDRPADELRDRMAVARTVDAATVAAFHGQIEQARLIDRQFGGAHHLDQLRHQIDHMQELLTYLPAVGQRAALAGALTEASALAGWQALDREDHTQALAHHERAKHAAREAGSPLLLAHATAQQTVILLALEDTSPAVEQAAYARSIATNGPALMRSWLAAAHGETLAAAGDRDAAMRAFDDAYNLLPADPVDPALPFLFLGGAHLARWRGNALALVGDAEALDQLTTALGRLPPTWVRARSRLLVDLAYAHAAAGERDAALNRAREARAIARQISSDRRLRRLEHLVLPQGRVA
jgi:tetratricopeptide (TPR) repeat protein